jgi:hypothetical protein
LKYSNKYIGLNANKEIQRGSKREKKMGRIAARLRVLR